MVDIFEHRVFSRDENIIDCTQMLCIFWKTNASGMRNNRDPKSKKELTHLQKDQTFLPSEGQRVLR